MKLKLYPGTYAECEVEGTPSEIAQLLTGLGRETAAPPVFVPQFQLLDACPMGGSHEYPESWMSTGPLACKKCHHQSTWWGQLTYHDQPNTGLMPPCRTEIVLRTQTGQPVTHVALLADQQAPQGCTD